ncbi:MAG TPA: hypothetical protein PLD20_31750 [Blastocatellia bacterium]|nr:hypothetical protein [Blastocatellia bacterium]HMV85002.1 hypothetical protein [Blastocatellia bacterium]HMX27859.1 hypothetical protein [Blastocatellia bacterium]HMZ22548.1 hypothetical protein [Blastocatellia bacterium]HNG34654.1 hypothetical protein [Blastocatellia bacterium]
MEFITSNSDFYLAALLTMAKFIALLAAFFAVTGVIVYLAGLVCLYRQETRQSADTRNQARIAAQQKLYSSATGLKKNACATTQA